MKNYKITWSPKAYKDLENIHYYIEYYLKEKKTANNIIKRLLIYEVDNNTRASIYLTYIS